MLKVPSGTRDIEGEEALKFEYIERYARDFFRRWGFEEIRTPIFEYEGVFRKTLGETSEVVMHQMFYVAGKEFFEVQENAGTHQKTERELFVLRPEGTAPVVRAYIERYKVAKPYTKFFYIGPMFRKERPQKGRLRQFHQIGCEIIGTADPSADAYLVFAFSEFFRGLDIKIKVKVNSVGCPNCRPKYSKALREFFKDVPLCPDCVVRRERNPLRILDCKEDADKTQDAPDIFDFLCSDCKGKFERFAKLLEKTPVEWERDRKLVRGLDYYTGVVFEGYHPSDEKNALGAGGRYDLLAKVMGDVDAPALGFAIGVERTLEFLKDKFEGKPKKVFLVYLHDVKDWAFEVFVKLKPFFEKEGILFEIDLREGKSLKAQMRYADSNGADAVLVLGKEEREGEFLTFKNMKTGKQEKIKIDEISQILKLLNEN